MPEHGVSGLVDVVRMRGLKGPETSKETPLDLLPSSEPSTEPPMENALDLRAMAGVGGREKWCGKERGR
mgnify:CR=1 FL=1